MTRTLAILVGLLGLASIASAQSAAGSSKLAWDQGGVATAAEAQGYTYRFYSDGSTAASTLTGVTCAGMTTVTCQTTFPPFAPGPHSLTLTSSNAAGESAKSAPLAFTFVVVPTPPTNPRIQ